jgi:chemotaxis protein MotB
VSYADFITLLFAFFVVMFAVSQVDSKKVGRFTEAFSKAVGIDVFPQSGMGLLAGTENVVSASSSEQSGTEMLPHELEGLKVALTKSAAKVDDMKGLMILQRRSEVVLRMPENVVFASGDDSVKEGAARALHVIAQELVGRPVDVRVEGHTDNRPIKTARFHSNWDLSTARATAVIMSLSREGIESSRLAAAGYGEFRPVASNATDEGRRANRRVDLVVSLTAPPDVARPVDLAPKEATKDAPKDPKTDPKHGSHEAKEQQ